MSNAMMFSQYEYKAPTVKKVWSHFCTLISCEFITLSSKLFKDIGFSKGAKEEMIKFLLWKNKLKGLLK